MIPGMGELWTQVGSAIASLMFVWAIFQNYFPHELRAPIRKYTKKLRDLVYPYIHVTFHEFQGDGFQRSKAYVAIERYLAAHSSTQAKRLKADVVKDSQSIVLSMDDNEEVADEYRGIKLWWTSIYSKPDRQSISFYPREDGKKYFNLKFHKKHREVVTSAYLRHVLDEGKAITVKERQRKLYTNSKSESWSRYSYSRSMWTHVVFEHPANFNTLAMEPAKKQEIIDDLLTFSKAKEYYARIGKAWKRGYLLYGPPGTGKSSMIAAMANLLKYDVYDLELTAVKDNTELRKLLIDTSGKSIIVIEDIDCSLDLTGQRENKEKEGEAKEEKDPIKEKMRKDEKKGSEVTLSGLLNFIDGLWSAIGGERLIVFTTNFMEKLDPALIRRGRMDKHIELSYCGIEAFKVLAKNYLEIETHELFDRIRVLLEETNMTPADVAENLMPKSAAEDADVCLERLIKALEVAKEEARLKAEEEEKRKAEKEEDEKKKEEQDAKEEADKKKKKKEEEDAKLDEKTVSSVKENGVAETLCSGGKETKED